MMDLRFPTALQMVLSLAVAVGRGERCTSDELAAGLGANPALVRKLLVPLGRDGIVVSVQGAKGGVMLGRDPSALTVLDVYRAAVGDKRLFASRPNVPGVCVVSRNIGHFFDAMTMQADDGLASLLAGKTVAQSLAEIEIIDTKA